MAIRLLLLAAALLSAQVTPRVRSSHPYIRAMIEEARVRSTTFRRLVEAIEATDGIVYVEEGECHHQVHACLLSTVSIAGDFRLLRVLVDARQEDWEVMSDIGHELQHALEILSERTARTNEQVFFLMYHTVAATQHTPETTAALRAGDAVSKEVEAFARNSTTKGQAR